MKSKYVQKYRYSLILLKELVITDFKLRYQGSALGYLWSLLRPLFLFVIMYFVFVYFLRIGNDIPHWPVALLLGIVLWNFFAEVTNNGVTSIVNQGDVIRKINFPKYIILLSGSVSALINLALNLVVIALFMIINKVDLHWLALISPLYILEIFIFALGIAFLLSALFVKLRDINYIWEIVMQGLFYASAVIYPISLVIEKSNVLAQVLLLNPVSQAIQDVRRTLVYDQTPTLYSVSGNNIVLTLVPIIFAIIVFIVGAWYFKKQSPTFAENV
jgi:ABC-2 type transport system permease protein